MSALGFFLCIVGVLFWVGVVVASWILFQWVMTEFVGRALPEKLERIIYILAALLGVTGFIACLAGAPIFHLPWGAR